jgi:hypothetical protein
MPIRQKGRANSKESNRPRLGLVANGSSGSWEVAIDETIRGIQKWFMQIEGPTVSLYFEIPSPSIVDRIHQFLEQLANSVENRPLASLSANKGSLRIGSFGQAAVRLQSDNEYRDRCFLVVGPAATSWVRLSLGGRDLSMLMQAIHQVRDDLTGEGLL